jgi:hypothetical protein
MAVHELKTWPGPFGAVLTGEKTFEWRRDDRTPPFATGDVLVLMEFIPCAQCGGGMRVSDHTDFVDCPCVDTPKPGGKFTGRQIQVRVTYLLRGEAPPTRCFGVPKGYLVMSIRKLRGH